MSIVQMQSRLPAPNPGVFSGNRLDFLDWIKCFETIFEYSCPSAKDRLYYLGRYTTGQAKDSIKAKLNQGTDKAYEEAKEILRTRFGDASLISHDYVTKLRKWPKISMLDSESLVRYSDFFVQLCFRTSSIELSV